MLSIATWRQCNICNGKYPESKHNFDECFSMDFEWDLLMIDSNFNILKEQHVIEWFNCIKTHNNIEDEKKWGNFLNKKYCNSIKDTNQWTTALSQHVVQLLLILNGHTIIKKQKHVGYDPDIETTDCVYEVKARNYNTTGTAGEKILGISKKYADIPILYNKKVITILCGYQEIEGRDKFKLFGGGSDTLKKILDFEKNIGFTYLCCSDLLKIIIS